MNPKDTLETATIASTGFNDRVTQFYDPNQRSGKLIVEGLPLKAEIAWDIYLFYGQEKSWNDTIPLPRAWMHQLSDTDGDSSHHCTTDQLAGRLHGAMSSLTQKNIEPS